MKTALINAIANMTETDAIALWSAISQWADNARGQLDETDTFTEKSKCQLLAAQALEEAGATAMAQVAEVRRA